MTRIFVGRMVSGLLLLMLPMLCYGEVVLQTKAGGSAVAVFPEETIDLRVSFTDFEQGLTDPDHDPITRFFVYLTAGQDFVQSDINAGSVSGVTGCTASSSGNNGSFFECERTGEPVSFDFGIDWNTSQDGEIIIATEHFYSIEDPDLGSGGSGFSFVVVEDSEESNSVDVRIKESGYVGFQFEGELRFEESAGIVSVMAERLEGSDGSLEVSVSVEESSAAAPADLDSDFELLTQSLSWADGEVGAKSIDIQLFHDAVSEPLESFTLDLSNDGDGSKEIFLINSPQPGFAAFRSADASFSESDGTVDIVLSRTGGQDGQLSASVSIDANGSATAGLDFRLLSPSVLWLDGDTADKSIAVALLPDDLIEGDESFALSLLQSPAASGTGQGPVSTEITIEDTTVVVVPTPGNAVFALAEVSLLEGASQTVVVNREGGVDGVLVVDLIVESGGTATEQEDFSLSVQSLRWEGGDALPKSFEINAVADQLQETRETLTVLLDGSTGSAPRLQVAILDSLSNDPADYEISVISGANQTGGLRTEELQPFVVMALDGGGLALEGVPVYWTITPQDAGTLSAGTESVTDTVGEAANVFTITKNGPIVVTVSLDENSSGGSQRTAQFSFDGGIAGLPGLNPEEKVFARGVDQACQSLEDAAALSEGSVDLQTICNELETSNTLTGDLNLLAFEEIASQGRLITETANFRVNNVRRRLDQIRRGEQGMNFSGLNVDLWGKKLPGSVLGVMTDSLKQASGGGDAFTSPWGGFINASIGIGDKESTSREIGFDFTVQDFSFGADYRLNNELALGAGLSWMGSETDFNGSSGNLDSDSLGLFVYATRYLSEQLYLDGVFSFSSRDFDIRRNLIGNNSAVGNTSGTDLTLGLSGGYEYQRGRHMLSPFFRVLYTSASVDAYTERATSANGSGAGTTLNIAKQSIDNGSLMLGGEWSTTISSEKGIFRPSARLELEHRLDSDARDVTAHFVNDPGSNTLTVVLDEPDTDFANLGLGVSAVFENGKSGAVFYETQLGHEGVTQHWLKLNWRWEF